MVASRLHERTAVSADPAIQVSELNYAYPRGPTVLDRISFEAAVGESVGLIGPNGAGKTSLFLCLSGVIAPKARTLRVGGLDFPPPHVSGECRVGDYRLGQVAAVVESPRFA